ncbi:ATP-binding protein [Streptomyces sp. NPDC001068]|uniref:ATP-binding protein n=1 Tax=Streptomyces sp. NPDC001068 TaxID=3364544 RepID=UPI0036B89959
MLKRRHDRIGRHMVAEDGAPVVTEVLAREPASVPAARRLVRHTLADWHLPELADAAELVVTELSTNAVQHARHAMFRVTLRRIAPDRVRVAVTDKSHTAPVLWPLDQGAEGGRGLALVAALASEWGTDPLAWGKRVWADLAPNADERPRRGEEVPMYGTCWAQLVYVVIVVALGASIAAAVVSATP